MVKIRECLHVHFTWLSLVPYLDFISQSINEHLFLFEIFSMGYYIEIYLLRQTLAPEVELKNSYWDSQTIWSMEIQKNEHISML